MRRLAKWGIGLFLTVAVIWSVGWVLLAETAKRQTIAWFEAQALSGRMAGHAGVSVSGFPFRLDLVVTDPYLANPFTGQSWAAPGARLSARGIAPLELRTDLAERHTFLLGGAVGAPEVVEVTGRDMTAALRLAGPDLALAGLGLEADEVTARGRSGWGVALAGLDVALTPDDDAAAALLHLRADARELALDAATLAVLGPEDRSAAGPAEGPGPVAAGLTLDTLGLVARLTLDAPVDRHLAGPPNLREIALEDLRMVMGTAELRGSGVLAVAPDGLPEGRIDLRLRDWRGVLARAVELGLLHPEIGQTWVNMFAMLSETAPDGAETVALPLTFRAGVMRLGPLPIGPAPVLALPY